MLRVPSPTCDRSSAPILLPRPVWSPCSESSPCSEPYGAPDGREEEEAEADEALSRASAVSLIQARIERLESIIQVLSDDHQRSPSEGESAGLRVREHDEQAEGHLAMLRQAEQAALTAQAQDEAQEEQVAALNWRMQRRMQWQQTLANELHASCIEPQHARVCGPLPTPPQATPPVAACFAAAARRSSNSRQSGSGTRRLRRGAQLRGTAAASVGSTRRATCALASSLASRCLPYRSTVLEGSSHVT